MDSPHIPLGVKVGDTIRWTIPTQGGPRLGIVREVGTAADSLEVDKMMGRQPGESLRLFGPHLGVQCDRASCTSCKGGWTPGWLHGLNECQVELIHGITPTVAVPLWGDDT